MFIELPDSGTGECKMKIGDGISTYSNLPYAMEYKNHWEGTKAQWDALTNEEKALWTGKYVIITDDDGIENEKIKFTSNDVVNTDTSKTDSGWTNTEILTSGETFSEICAKVSNMFKNIRRLWNTVGTTVLSTTITEAITTLNTKYTKLSQYPMIDTQPLTVLDLFSTTVGVHNFFIDDTDNITDWSSTVSSIRLRYSSCTIFRYNGACASIHIIGVNGSNSIQFFGTCINNYINIKMTSAN